MDVVSVLLLDGSPVWIGCPAIERITCAGVPAPRAAASARLATPRWVVDPDFDLSWHVRRFEAAPLRTLANVLEFARKTGMAGLDRDRPLWEFTSVEELEGGQTAWYEAAPLADDLGGMRRRAAAVRRRTRPRRPSGDARCAGARALRPVVMARDALAYDWSQLFDFSKRHLTSAPGDVAHVLRHPRATVTETVATARSIARFVEPVPETLSPP